MRNMDLESRELRALLKLVIVLILTSVSMYHVLNHANLVSYTTITRSSINLIMVGLIIVSLVVSILKFQQRPAKSGLFLISALLIVFIIHLLSSVYILLFGVNLHQIGIRVSTHYLFEIFIFALYLLIALSINGESSLLKNRLRTRLYLTGVIFAPLLVFTLAWFYLVHFAPSELLFAFRLISGVLGSAIFGLLITKAMKFKTMQFGIDPGYFISAIALLWISFIILAFHPDGGQWIYSENLIIASFFVLGFSTGIPHLRRIGFNRSFSYMGILIVQMLIYIPFLTIIVLESGLIAIPLSGPNLFAYTIMHLVSCIIALMMGSLLLVYSNIYPRMNHYPIVLFFYLWGAASGISAIAFYLPLPSYNEPFIAPYTSASVIAVFIQVLIIARTTQSRKSHVPDHSAKQLGLLGVFFFILLLIAEYIQQFAYSTLNLFVSSNIARGVIIITNSIMLVGFIYLLFYLYTSNRGSSSVEAYLVIYCTALIVPNIFMIFYHQWSSGWYISELLIFGTFIVGPVIFAWLYVKALNEYYMSKERANLFADILIHDITNYNQIALSSVELVANDNVPSDNKDDLLETARHAIFMADRIISDVRFLNEIEQIDESFLQEVNLASMIIGALDVIAKHYDSIQNRIFLEIIDNAQIRANDSLQKAFINLIIFILDSLDNNDILTIKLKPVHHTESAFWQVSLSFPYIDNLELLELKDLNSLDTKTLRLQVVVILIKRLGGNLVVNKSQTDGMIKVIAEFPSISYFDLNDDTGILFNH